MKIEIKIREVRESKGMSLNELSRQTGISKSHLSNIERGEKEPGISVLVRIAMTLNVDVELLYQVKS